ncbi:MAG: adenylate/guanylate cyclase domain-containing protein [Acidimicrobiia bacterium]
MTSEKVAPAAAPIIPPSTWDQRLPRWSLWLGNIGTRPDDDEEARLRKASMVLTVCLIVVLATVWVVSYAVLGLPLSAAIPLTYQVVSLGGLTLLARTRNFEFFRTSQLTLMTLLPVLLHWSLGGFVASGGVIIWSLATPLIALVYSRRPLAWFLFYLFLTGISGLVEPLLTRAAMPAAARDAFFVINIGGVSTVVYFLLRYFTQGLAFERQKSEALLLNVLPSTIARRLKAGERPLADHFDDAVVLFADLVGFTPLTERLAPDEIVELLDGLFSQFDDIADRRGLEKIKTLGDAYMVVGGLPEPSPHAVEAAAEMALEMQEVVAHSRAPRGEALQLRIGIDVGPVVAGVIGRRKFSYDLWGDTVNTASRMESQGLPGQIQVTLRAYEKLRHLYEFMPRDPLEVKGKGTIVPYLLVRRHSAPIS